MCSYFVHRGFLGQPRLMTPRDPHPRCVKIGPCASRGLHLAQTSVRLSPTQSPLLLQSSLERRVVVIFPSNSCGLYGWNPINRIHVWYIYIYMLTCTININPLYVSIYTNTWILWDSWLTFCECNWPFWELSIPRFRHIQMWYSYLHGAFKYPIKW